MKDYQAHFLRQLVPAVLRWQQRSGLPASVVLAQAILESNWGRSLLAHRHRNLFGIKAHARATTPAVVYSTTEYTGGRPRRQKARFAHYASYEACLEDYARLLAGSRYAPARAVAANPFAFATELQRCGYATDPRYAYKLRLLIRRYDLTQFDLPAGLSAEVPRRKAEAEPAAASAGVEST